MVKNLLLWLILCLIQVPIIKFVSSKMKIERLVPYPRDLHIQLKSFGHTYLVFLLVSGAVALLKETVDFLFPENYSWPTSIASMLILGGIFGWGLGHFVKDSEGQTIGIWKGTQLMLLSMIVYSVLILALLLAVKPIIDSVK